MIMCEISYLYCIPTETLYIKTVTRNTTVNASSTVMLTCVAYGYPAYPSITWYFNGVPIKNTTSCQVRL